MNLVALGVSIRKLREALGLSQRDLVRLSKISHCTVSRLERGTGRIPSLVTLLMLARVLGVKTSYLVASAEME